MAPHHCHLDISSFLFGCGEKQHHIAEEFSSGSSHRFQQFRTSMLPSGALGRYGKQNRLTPKFPPIF